MTRPALAVESIKICPQRSVDGIVIELEPVAKSINSGLTIGKTSVNPSDTVQMSDAEVIQWPNRCPFCGLPPMIGNYILDSKRHTLARLDSFVRGTAGKRLTYKALTQ